MWSGTILSQLIKAAHYIGFFAKSNIGIYTAYSVKDDKYRDNQRVKPKLFS